MGVAHALRARARPRSKRALACALFASLGRAAPWAAADTAGDAAGGEGDAPAPPQVLKLSLKQCAELALQYNPRVREATLDVADRERKLANERGAWVPTLSASGLLKREVVGEPFAFNDPRGRFTNTGPGFEAGLKGLAPLGTLYGVKAKSELLWTTRNAESISPQYRNRLGVELTQPLLRGWGVPTVMAAQRAAELEREVARGAGRGVGDDVLLELTRAYWELYIRYNLLETQRGASITSRSRSSAHAARARATPRGSCAPTSSSMPTSRT
ncbi:MAG: TolC family protein [Proteobacteria bacterium]|nr:TolC family protein [Pseudomonadota bacterium]